MIVDVARECWVSLLRLCWTMRTWAKHHVARCDMGCLSIHSIIPSRENLSANFSNAIFYENRKGRFCNQVSSKVQTQPGSLLNHEKEKVICGECERISQKTWPHPARMKIILIAQSTWNCLMIHWICYSHTIRTYYVGFQNINARTVPRLTTSIRVGRMKNYWRIEKG